MSPQLKMRIVIRARDEQEISGHEAYHLMRVSDLAGRQGIGCPFHQVDGIAWSVQTILLAARRCLHHRSSKWGAAR